MQPVKGQVFMMFFWPEILEKLLPHVRALFLFQKPHVNICGHFFLRLIMEVTGGKLLEASLKIHGKYQSLFSLIVMISILDILPVQYSVLDLLF